MEPIRCKMYGVAVPLAPEPVIDLVPALARLDRRAGLWLFGSWARGRASPSSDVDALVALSSREHVDEIRLLCKERGLSVVITDQSQLPDLPARSPLLALHLCTEGRLIWGDAELPRISWRTQHREAATRRAIGKRRSSRYRTKPAGTPISQEIDRHQIMVITPGMNVASSPAMLNPP